jgi:hypothetical protein
MAPRNKAIRGIEEQLRLTKDGAPVKSFPVTELSVEEDAELNSSAYLGDTTEEPDKVHKGWTGSFGIEVTGPEWQDIEDADIQRQKDRVALINFNLVRTQTYRDGTSSAWSYQGLVMKFSDSVGSRSDKVKKKVEFRCKTRVKLA